MQARNNARKQNRRPSRKIGKLPLFLLLCFPLGLVMMWSDRCTWSRAAKSAVSGLFALIALAIVLPQTLPPVHNQGGVKLVGTQVEVEVFGPEAPENLPAVEIYIPQPTIYDVAVEPTPTPVNVYVNDGGKYYHVRYCKYVKNTTGVVSITAAVNAGYTRCMECNAPAEAQ